ncbi:MAG: nucleotide exchange factor GrpE [Chloroflexota bacterium]|nr:MAG: nucleotide exchange factor GrpE [Chloroflexota bacterium]
MIEEIKSEVEDTKEEEEQVLEQDEELEVSEELEVDEVELLKEEIESLQHQSEEYLDGWQRERAEFANFKKRTDRERQQLQHSISGNIIRKYLEILDDLERALQNKPTDDEGASWAEGIELVYRKFLTALEAEGVVPMEVANQQFDPNLHEAISQEPNDDYESGQVIEVVRNGYMIGDRVLRPATVRVAQ